MSLFEYSNYKDYLKNVIAENSHQRGFQAVLAKAAGCQPSYLSQALTGKAELLPDHAAGIADHLEFSEFETEYFIHLVLLGRASTSSLIKIIEKKLAQMRTAQNQLINRMPAQTKINKEIEKFYYSSWYWLAIHIATSTPKLQTIKALSERLALPVTKVKSTLEVLQKYGLVKLENDRWKYNSGASHLGSDSLMTEMNHMHWRNRAILNVQKDEGNSLHYTSVVSMTLVDAVKMKEFLTQMISKSRKISDPSVPEEVFCFNLDFFNL